MGGGRGTSWSSSCGDGDGSGNENPDAITPVARDTMLGAWAVSSSGVWWYGLGHKYPKTILDSLMVWGISVPLMTLLKYISMLKELSSSTSRCAKIVISNVINKPLSIWKNAKTQKGMGIVSSQACVIGWGVLDSFVRQFCEANVKVQILRSGANKCGAHNLLKPSMW